MKYDQAHPVHQKPYLLVLRGNHHDVNLGHHQFEKSEYFRGGPRPQNLAMVPIYEITQDETLNKGRLYSLEPGSRTFFPIVSYHRAIQASKRVGAEPLFYMRIWIIRARVSSSSVLGASSTTFAYRPSNGASRLQERRLSPTSMSCPGLCQLDKPGRAE